MEKYNPNEGNDSLKRILLMMKYDNKKTLSENLNEQAGGKAIRNRNVGLSQIKSILSNYGIEVTENSKLPEGYANPGTLSIKNIGAVTNIGNLYFFVFKPGGYWTSNNFVLKVSNKTGTLGTWDLDRLYFKTDGDVSFNDKGFNNIVNIDKVGPAKTSQPAKYSACTGTYKIYCYNKPVIGKVQGCLGLKQDGYFGPKTQKALKLVGYGEGFKDQDVDKICELSQKSKTPTRDTATTSSTLKPAGIKAPQTATPTVASESVKKDIKESLIKIHTERQNVLTEEKRILKNRINVLTEGKNFKNRKDVDKFATDVINEVFTLRSQGFDEDMINESLLDMITGFFGKSTSSIFEVIKEKLVGWIIKKLGFSTDSVFADIIIVGFANVDFKDFNKLFDCKYLSDLIVNAIVEGVAKNMLDRRSRTGQSSTFMDLLRNTMAEYFKDSSFENKLSGGLEAILCPLMGGIKSKMDDAADDIKDKFTGE